MRRDLAPVLFLSAEPLIGPIDFHDRRIPHSLGSTRDFLTGGGWSAASDGGAQIIRSPRHVDLVIVGGESGPGARPCSVEWVRSIVRQCAEAGVACFVKQLGEAADVTGLEWTDWPAREKSARYNEKSDLWLAVLSDKKGGNPDEWPVDLRVRQMPEVCR